MILFEQEYEKVADNLHAYVEQAIANEKAEMLIVRIETTVDQSALILKVYLKESGKNAEKRIGCLSATLDSDTLISILEEEGFVSGHNGGYIKNIG